MKCYEVKDRDGKVVGAYPTRERAEKFAESRPDDGLAVSVGYDTRCINDPTPKMMQLTEFRALGYLQEANRLFFHPRGLALEMQIDDVKGICCLSGIRDARDEPEAMVFCAPAEELVEKMRSVHEASLAAFAKRAEVLGYVVQSAHEGGVTE